ncbi:MAG: hypothetical protein ACRDPY_24135 [Streptosporangiaceae bacterium]
MPSIAHEAAVELLRRSPQLAAALLASAGVRVPTGAAAVLADSNLSVPEPTELRADVVTVHQGSGRKIVIVTEVQKDPPDGDKRRAWVAYLALAQVEHKCDAALVVIALRERTARASGRPIPTGHPGFVLTPIVIGPDTAPPPAAPGTGPVSAELAVLAVLTGALDLGDAETRRMVLQAIARLDAGRREIYTRLIRATASAAVRRALEELMATVFHDDFIDGLLAQGEERGRAQGEAAMLMRVLAARGFTVPDDIRQRIQSCTDLGQIEAWGERAVTANSLDEIFTA